MEIELRAHHVVIAILLGISLALFWIAFQPIVIMPLNGTSMEPTFRDGDYVVAMRADLYLFFDSDLRGDVVIFEAVKMVTPYTAVGYYICHRVTYWDGERFNTKGDANPREDFPEPVPAEAIKYVVLFGISL